MQHLKIFTIAFALLITPIATANAQIIGLPSNTAPTLEQHCEELNGIMYVVYTVDGHFYRMRRMAPQPPGVEPLRTIAIKTFCGSNYWAINRSYEAEIKRLGL